MSLGLVEPALTALVAMYITAHLVRNLGVSLYGLVAVTNSLVMYFLLGQTIITTAVGRFTMVELKRGRPEAASRYFATAFWGLVAGCSLLWAVGYGLVEYTDWLGLAAQPEAQGVVSTFFLLTLAGGLVYTLGAPFNVATLVTHRMYLQKTFACLGLVLKLGLVAALVGPAARGLLWLGVANLASQVLPAVLALWACLRFLPAVSLGRRELSWTAWRDMAAFGGWSLMDQLAVLLFFSTDLVLLNWLSTAAQAGIYAPLVQISYMVVTLTDAVGYVFRPVAFERAASDDHQAMRAVTLKAIRYLAIFMGPVAGLVCGYGEPILRLWLGTLHASHYGILWILVGLRILTTPFVPIQTVLQGLNRVRPAAVASLVCGAANCLLTIAFLMYTDLGLWGVALATALGLMAKNAGFLTIYYSRLLRAPWGEPFRVLLPGLGFFVFSVGMALGGRWLWPVDGWVTLVVHGGLVGLATLAGGWLLFLDREDRRVFLSLLEPLRALATSRRAPR